jgi:threonyl-tRNA synthetase
VVGDKEAEKGEVAVRHRAEGDLGVMKIDEFEKYLRDVVDAKARK